MDEVDNPNLAGGPIGGSDIAVYKVETSYILGEVHSFPYALTKEQIEAIDGFIKDLDDGGVTNEILKWISYAGLPTGTTQQPPTSSTTSPYESPQIDYIREYFNLESKFKFGEDWASNYYKSQYKRNIWPACFPLIDGDYPPSPPNIANSLTVGWRDVGPSFEQDDRRKYLNENREIFFEEVYSGKSRVRKSFD